MNDCFLPTTHIHHRSSPGAYCCSSGCITSMAQTRSVTTCPYKIICEIHILLHPVPCTCSEQVFEYLEFFAGHGNLSRVMRSADYTTASFDLLYNTQPAHRRSNFMDLTHASGFGFLCQRKMICYSSVRSLRLIPDSCSFLKWQFN